MPTAVMVRSKILDVGLDVADIVVGDGRSKGGGGDGVGMVIVLSLSVS